MFIGNVIVTYHRLMKRIFNLWNFKPRYGKDTHDFYLLDLFVVHDNLHVDFVNPQMLRCIICRFEQTFDKNLNQSSIAKKHFNVKYNKTNGITLMKMC
jgi:hypothetical protein